MEEQWIIGAGYFVYVMACPYPTLSYNLNTLSNVFMKTISNFIRKKKIVCQEVNTKCLIYYGLNEKDIAPYTDIELQLTKY